MFPGEKHVIKLQKMSPWSYQDSNKEKVQFGIFISETVGGTVLENNFKNVFSQ